MAKIKNATPFDSVRKKFSGTDEIHFKNRKVDNATIGVRVKHPYDGGNSTNQQAVRAKFSQVAATVKAIMNAKSTDTDTANYTKLVGYEEAFKNQKKYLYLRDSIFAQEYAL